MRFVLDVDIDLFGGDPHAELARILRFWAGNVQHYEVRDGVGETVNGADYTPVGSWRFSTGA